MFDSQIYIARRDELKKKFKKGILLFLGNQEAPMNYAGNTYRFRQDSTFLYYWGLNQPGLAAIINIDGDQEIIFGDDRTIDDIIWMGFEKNMLDKANSVGVSNVKSFGELPKYIEKQVQKERKIHFLPQYRYDNIFKIDQLLDIKISKVSDHVSKKFVKAVIEQRSIKADEEIKEIEKALEISHQMNVEAMKLIEPGKVEREIFGKIEGIALSCGGGVSFPIIFSVDGQILHNHSHDNVMKKGQIAVLDSGAETTIGYASDITRTIPISGKFTNKQKDVYNIVLQSQLKAIEMIRPGIKFKDIHIEAAKVIAKGLTELGIMKGDVEEAVEKGAHALFFPHGLGHMMGLDVHDMENLGENYVGYDKSLKRSKQFGLAYLRFGKELNSGFVLTVEPGCYFIPALIDKWEGEEKHSQFINYENLKEYRDFGGIRIEDDVLVTEEGFRVLGRPIPKTVDEIEKACEK